MKKTGFIIGLMILLVAVAVSAICNDPVANVGERYCEGQLALECEDKGFYDEWELVEDCSITGKTCSDGACGSNQQCSDTDANAQYPFGNNVFERGRVTDKFGDLSPYDSCNGGRINEWSCSETELGQAALETFTCPLGICQNGACTSSQKCTPGETDCETSPGTVPAYYTQCNTEGTDWKVFQCPAGKTCIGNSCVSDPCAQIICPDVCEGSSKLYGGLCSDGRCEYLQRSCPEGCRDGRCITEPRPTPTLTPGGPTPTPTPCVGENCEESFCSENPGVCVGSTIFVILAIGGVIIWYIIKKT